MIFFAATNGSNKEELIAHMNKVTSDWTSQAARGECGWICADCCSSFPKGMPDECDYGDDRCTGIIKRDKIRAMGAEA